MLRRFEKAARRAHETVCTVGTRFDRDLAHPQTRSVMDLVISQRDVILYALCLRRSVNASGSEHDGYQEKADVIRLRTISSRRSL